MNQPINLKCTFIQKATSLLILLFIASFQMANAQEANALLMKVKAKLDKVNDYSADARMKTTVSFLKVPVSEVKVYYKRPNKLKIKNEQGFSFVPKGATNLNINNIINSGKYSVIDGGIDKSASGNLRILKLLPEDDNGDIVLSTLYIDEKNQVVIKAKTTTRENGSYVLEMTYGKYINDALPDKILLTFNIKDYKLPKGVTFDFDDGAKKKKEKPKETNGSAEITFSSYVINKGLKDDVFK